MKGFLLFCLVFVVYGAPSKDRITSLPGFSGKLDFEQYSGYLPVNNGKEMFFYWFVEAVNNPSEAPIALWLNGGPLCSSLGGFFTEHGPFIVNSEGTELSLRDTSWNKLANMLYIETPAGVGLSYGVGKNASSPYSTDDHETSMRNHEALIAFFKLFPEYQNSDFYITGESYAGTYIPTLVRRIVMTGLKNQPFNLKGFMIGNPCTDPIFDHNAFYDLVATHAVISPSTAAEIFSNCPTTGRYILDNSCCQFNQTMPPQSQECITALKQMYVDFSDINLYGIYLPCVGGDSGESPCLSAGAAPIYLDNPEVRKAIHAAPLNVTGKWEDCNSHENHQYTSNWNSIFKQVYPDLINQDLRIMIYSGTTDACVPYFSTQAWTEILGGEIVDPWKVWHVNEQVAGYSQGYENLRFTTILQAGHLVPADNPHEAFTMFQTYLNGTW